MMYCYCAPIYAKAKTWHAYRFASNFQFSKYNCKYVLVQMFSHTTQLVDRAHGANNSHKNVSEVLT